MPPPLKYSGTEGVKIRGRPPKSGGRGRSNLVFFPGPYSGWAGGGVIKAWEPFTEGRTDAEWGGGERPKAPKLRRRAEERNPGTPKTGRGRVMQVGVQDSEECFPCPKGWQIKGGW